MPPKIKYARKDVIQAAVAIVEEHGAKELTARSVAAKLNSSTAPVYKQFATMDELALEVIRHTQKLLLEYTHRPYTSHLFLNMGVGIAMFSSEHSELYRAILLEGDNYRDVILEFLDSLEVELARDERCKSLTADERRELLHKMWLFTHGLASVICVGLVKECDRESIIKTLSDIGFDVISATIARHEKNAQNE